LKKDIAMNAHAEQPEAIFLAALDKATPDERAAYVEAACAGDPELLRRLRVLLACHEGAPGPLDDPPAGLARSFAETSLPTERLGSVIGPYKLKEQIGEGGMGLVFVAEQHEPVRRKVALKLIKPGMDSRQVIARFEAERQALALMNHANIAKVFDGGETPSGRPYFVMELVKGVPITEYCDENRLTPRARLELFGQVCAAVQHAHQKGIIHRDLKPSNVMVVSHDGTPVVKVIDFGVAKAIGQLLTDKSVYTQFTQFIGTPLYMSPEQAGQSGIDVDTRTDIYALGVLLYELLTGTTPFDKERLQEASYDEIRRLIREEEPPKPSTRMSTLAQAGSTVSAQRQSNPQQLCLLLRGELDWIVMKALEKDRNRRYESANALAADVERYLQDEPVQACPPSRRYLIGKFLRRHRTGVVIAAALLGGVILFATGGSWIVLDRATRQAMIEQAVAEDLREADTWQREQRWLKVQLALERANGRLLGSQLGTLQTQVDERWRDLSLVVRLEEVQLKASSVSRNQDRDYAGADLAYRNILAELGLNFETLGKEAAARRIRESRVSAQIVTALDYWAWVKDNRIGRDGAPLRAIANLADDNAWRHELRDPLVARDRRALERLAEREAVLDQPPVNLQLLSYLLDNAKAQEARIGLLRRAQERYPANFWINYELGLSLGERHHKIVPDWITYFPPEANAYFRVAVAIQPERPDAFYHLGRALESQNDLAKAEAAYRKAITVNPQFALAYEYLGDLMNKQYRYLETIALFRKTKELKIIEIDHYFGATASAAVGCGEGKGGAFLDVQERLLLRDQALHWLRLELTIFQQRFSKEPEATRLELKDAMQYWKTDKDLSGVRDAAALAKLPDTERREWQMLWDDVDALERLVAEPK
jgi:serine/threonine protein kinase/tetratricopeptide (TPR) repeat protein